MPRKIDYYFSLVSPWAYIGHAPFMEIAQRHGLEINYKPVFLGRVFAETGGSAAGRSGIRRGSDIGCWNFSAGAKSAGLSFNLQPEALAVRRHAGRPAASSPWRSRRS